MQEIWKDVIGWEAFYQVSNIGNVKSKNRVQRTGSLMSQYIKKGRVLKAQPNSKGYLRVELKNLDISKKWFVHRLVAVHFCNNNFNKPHVNHIDFNYTNNNYLNLEWCTHKENMNHSHKVGRMNRSSEWKEKNKHAEFRGLIKVIGINKKNGNVLVVDGINNTKELGFNPSDVCNVCKGKRNISKGYIWNYLGIDTIDEKEFDRLIGEMK